MKVPNAISYVILICQYVVMVIANFMNINKNICVKEKTKYDCNYIQFYCPQRFRQILSLLNDHYRFKLVVIINKFVNYNSVCFFLHKYYLNKARTFYFQIIKIENNLCVRLIRLKDRCDIGSLQILSQPKKWQHMSRLCLVNYNSHLNV